MQISDVRLSALICHERYLSVACLHFAAFRRAAQVGCRTELEELQRADDTIYKQRLASVSGTLVDHGWTWVIGPWVLEHVWLSLPHLAQQALNADRAVQPGAPGLDVAASIAERARLMGDGVDWGKVVVAAHASRFPCRSCIEVTDQFVKVFGGGLGAATIRYPHLLNHILRSCYEPCCITHVFGRLCKRASAQTAIWAAHCSTQLLACMSELTFQCFFSCALRVLVQHWQPQWSGMAWPGSWQKAMLTPPGNGSFR